jgi:nitroimidazol reductase NimA-like FMN-containing flavoprotein (pyridoxamine 5'-phosphate oxidase superfamily)
MALELTTYGDLKKVIRAIALKQKGEKIGNIALGTLMGFIPGAEAAKTTFEFIKAAISKPDTKKTKTWLDKLDIDDEMSAIVDDTVENGFMQMMSKTIESKPDTQELEPDFNMNAEMVNYLKDKYEGRTVSGIQENREMDLKEYIKELVRKEMDEMSVSGDAGPYSTPIAFAKKGQKTNAAIKTAQSQGMKLVPKGMPKNSKMLDYKELWKGKKSAMNNESNYDKVSQQGQPSEYSKPSGYTAASGYTAPSGYDKNENMKESLLNIIEKEMINEVTYGKFKKDVKHRTKSEQLHKAIREVKRKLAEIDRIVEYTSRMKQELSEDGGINYWKATQKNVATISEMVNQLNNKIKNLNQ